MPKSQKTFLFIDGSNLYGGQYDLFGPDEYLDFPLYIKEIEKSLQIRFSHIYFYASFSPKPNKPNKKQKQYLKNEGLFYKSVRKTKNVIFFKGYRSPTSGKEKEVDVKLTADLVHLAHINAYDNLYLMTGDADFLQALHVIKSLRKTTFLLCISNKIMFRGAFFYKTFIISFNNQLKCKFHLKQNVQIVKFDQKLVIKKT